MSLFSKKPVNSSDLKNKSVAAISTFNQVMEDLHEINTASVFKQAELKSQAIQIQEEINALEEINIANSKVITNIEKILA